MNENSLIFKKRQENPTRNHLDEKTVDNLIKPIRGMDILFIFFGLNIFNARRRFKSFIPDLLKKFAIFFWILLGIHTILLFFTSTERTFKLKAKMSKKSCEVVAFVLWITLYSKKDCFSNVFQDILKLGAGAKVLPSEKVSRFIIAFLIFWNSLYCLSHFMPYGFNVNFFFLSYFTHEQFQVQQGNKQLLFYPLFSVYAGFTETLPLLFMALYTFMCDYMHKIYLDYRNKISHSLKFTDKKDFDIGMYVDAYEKILETLKKFENCMSLPIFATLIITTLNLFLVTSGMITRRKVPNLNIAILLLIQELFALALISQMASKINCCDREVRKLNIELFEKYLYRTENPHLENVASFLIDNSKPEFVLSAFGFFSLTKNFSLVAVGCVATYTLLFEKIFRTGPLN